MMGAELASDSRSWVLTESPPSLELAEDVLHRLAFAAVAVVDFRLDEVVRGDERRGFRGQGRSGGPRRFAG